jgi:hypothetical protein
MIVGAVGFIVSLLFWASWGGFGGWGRSHTVYRRTGSGGYPGTGYPGSGADIVEEERHSRM